MGLEPSCGQLRLSGVEQATLPGGSDHTHLEMVLSLGLTYLWGVPGVRSLRAVVGGWPCDKQGLGKAETRQGGVFSVQPFSCPQAYIRSWEEVWQLTGEKVGAQNLALGGSSLLRDSDPCR